MFFFLGLWSRLGQLSLQVSFQLLGDCGTCVNWIPTQMSFILKTSQTRYKLSFQQIHYIQPKIRLLVAGSSYRFPWATSSPPAALFFETTQPYSPTIYKWAQSSNVTYMWSNKSCYSIFRCRLCSWISCTMRCCRPLSQQTYPLDLSQAIYLATK